jgi:hypothetical protein
MTRHLRTLTLVAAWFAMLASAGCAPPVSQAADATPAEKKPPATKPDSKKAAAEQVPLQDAGKDAWGTLSGKFKFVGEAPKMKQITPTKDVAVCGAKEPLVEESVIVSSSGEFANVVVFAMPSADKWDEAISPVHPELVKRKDIEATLQVVNCRFEPHVLGGWTKQAFWFRNKDPGIGHSPFLKAYRNGAVSPYIPATSDYTLNIRKAERLPFEVSCSIHPWMKAFILVRPDPYFAISAKDGTFKIENLPARKFAFQIWHEALGYVKTITVDGQKLVDNKGIHTWTVNAGNNDLGEVEIAAADYAKQLEKYK